MGLGETSEPGSLVSLHMFHSFGHKYRRDREFNLTRVEFFLGTCDEEKKGIRR